MRSIKWIAPLALLFLANCAVSQYGHLSNTYTYNKTVSGWHGSAADPTDRRGEACASSFGLFFPIAGVGDASVEAAAANGGITKVHSVNYELSMGHIFQEWCTVVRGQ